MTADAKRAAPAGDRGLLLFVHREVVLLTALVAITVAAFFVTRAVAAGTARLRLSDAAEWYEVGQRQLREGHAGEAIASLRHATRRDPDNIEYVRALAHALIADHQDDAARQVLRAAGRRRVSEEP
jgi:Flp pilus assembly protein TadD